MQRRRHENVFVEVAGCHEDAFISTLRCFHISFYTLAEEPSRERLRLHLDTATLIHTSCYTLLEEASRERSRVTVTRCQEDARDTCSSPSGVELQS